MYQALKRKILLKHIVLENKDYLFSKNWEPTNCNCQGALLRLGRRCSQVKRHTQMRSLQWTWPVLSLHRFLRNAIANTSMTAQSHRDLFFHSVEVQNQRLHGSCFFEGPKRRFFVLSCISMSTLDIVLCLQIPLIKQKYKPLDLPPKGLWIFFSYLHLSRPYFQIRSLSHLGIKLRLQNISIGE